MKTWSTVTAILAGGVLGATLGYVGKCASGTCPFTANPYRGALFGALVAAAFALTACSKSPTEPETPAPENVKQLTDEKQWQTHTAEGVVLVDFYADWCGPCKQLAPELNALATQMGAGFSIVKVNVDKHRGLAEKHEVSSIPHMLLIKDGAPVDKQVGYASAGDIRKWVESKVQ